jgi:hypothetical protein
MDDKDTFTVMTFPHLRSVSGTTPDMGTGVRRRPGFLYDVLSGGLLVEEAAAS